MARADFITGLIIGACLTICAAQAVASGAAPGPPAGGALLELPSLPGSTPPAAPPPAPADAASAPNPPAAPMQPNAPSAALPPATVSPATPTGAASSAPPAQAKAAPAAATHASPPAFPPVSAPPPAPVQALAPAPPPAPPPNPALIKAEQEVATKNTGILLAPMDAGTATLMFSASDMKVILEALAVYDNVRAEQAKAGAEGDDFSSLLDSIKARGPNGEPEPETPKALPNIYLGSIVYYSPAQWSVWINGKKLMNKNNVATAEFYVDRISPKEIELIWKPAFLLDTMPHWRRMTETGTHPLENISVDESKGKIILQLRPNQTFLPRELAIREGLIKAALPATPAAANPASPLPGAATPPNIPVYTPFPGTRGAP